VIPGDPPNRSQAARVRCAVHGGWESRAGRVWGRDGHLGATQADVLRWLEAHPGWHHFDEVYRDSGVYVPAAGRALSVLIAAGSVELGGGDGEHVRITAVGVASLDAYPTQLLGRVRRAS